MSRFALYYNGGSLNRGCEALAATTAKLIKDRCGSPDVALLSFAPDEDREAGIENIDEIVDFNFIDRQNARYRVEKNSAAYLRLFALGKISPAAADRYFFDRAYRKNSDTSAMLERYDIFISTGGDNYCYGDSIAPAAALNRALKRLKKRTVLWGCSVGREDLTAEKEADLAAYDLITARESITFDLLREVCPQSNIFLHADPAFTLGSETLPLPDGFVEGETVGINISPMILGEGTDDNDIRFAAVRRMVEYILDQTGRTIALIPHVFHPRVSDLAPLKKLMDIYSPTGRVLLIGADRAPGARQLKGYIARCGLFVGARTHATIAAYSSCVPTLVLGYSVKSTGIARDIFGSEEGLVVQMGGLKDENILAEHFAALLDHRDAYRQTLSEKMPLYTQSAREAADRLARL